jgi:hypothetical protein
LAEVQDLLASQLPSRDDYLPLLRLGQLPTANGLETGNDQIIFQQVSPLGGGAAGGSGNQNYLLRGDFSLSEKLQISAYYTYADDPLYNAPESKPNNPGNLWTIYGGALKGRLAGGKAWQWAAEGALELFSVGSGCGGSVSCTGGELGNANIFNDSGQKVWARNIVGSTPEELRALRDGVRRMLKENAPPPQAAKWADIAVLEPVRDYKARHSSTLLTFDAVVDAIGQIEARESLKSAD